MLLEAFSFTQNLLINNIITCHFFICSQIIIFLVQDFFPLYSSVIYDKYQVTIFLQKNPRSRLCFRCLLLISVLIIVSLKKICTGWIFFFRKTNPNETNEERKDLVFADTCHYPLCCNL